MIIHEKTRCRLSHLGWGSLVLLFLVSGIWIAPWPARCIPPSEPSAIANPVAYEGKKVLHINSLCRGSAWSEGIAAGIEGVLAETNVTLKSMTLDTEKQASDILPDEVGLQGKLSIETFQPNVVITSDDLAFKNVIQLHFRNTDLPVVFCGLNWNASIYAAPYRNTTGIIEMALIPQLLQYLRQNARGETVGYLAANVPTARKEGTYYQCVFQLSIRERYVNTMREWQEAFARIQTEVDLLIVGNTTGIDDWDDATARAFAVQQTRVPTGAIYESLMPYTLLGLTKVAQEQGRWAAQAALRILDGERPSDIPVTKTKQGKLIVNLSIAETLNITFAPSVLRKATILQ